MKMKLNRTELCHYEAVGSRENKKTNNGKFQCRLSWQYIRTALVSQADDRTSILQVCR